MFYEFFSYNFTNYHKTNLKLLLKTLVPQMKVKVSQLEYILMVLNRTSLHASSGRFYKNSLLNKYTIKRGIFFI